jgi:hypothetical protein
MSAKWAARDKQPILPTSTNPCIIRAAGTQVLPAAGLSLAGLELDLNNGSHTDQNWLDSTDRNILSVLICPKRLIDLSAWFSHLCLKEIQGVFMEFSTNIFFI